MLHERNVYAVVDRDGAVVKASDRSYDYDLLGFEIGELAPRGVWQRTGVAFPAVYRLDATDLASARAGAEQLAQGLTSAATLPRFEISDTGHATIEQRPGFTPGGIERPVVAVLHDAAAGAWYAAPFRERPFPMLGKGGRDEGWGLRETRSFTAPAGGPVAGVLHLGQWVDLSSGADPAPVTITH